MANKKKDNKNSVESINEEQFRELVRGIIYEQMEDMGDPFDVEMNQQVPEYDEGEEDVYLGTEKNKTKSQEESLNEKEEKGGMTSVGDPMDQEMNRMDSETNKSGQGKSHGKAEKTKGKTSAGNVTDQKMNSRDNDLGSDGDSAVAVGVDAQNSTYSDGYKKGMHQANMYSKKGMNDVDNEMGGEDTGEPHYDVEMNSQDQELGSDEAKAYVEPSGEMKNGYNVGQKKPKFSEKPKNEEDPYGRIAKGMEISESFEGKEALKKSELEELINERAQEVLKQIKKEESEKKS